MSLGSREDPLKIFVLSILLKDERKGAWPSSVGSLLHKDGAMTEKAQFSIDVFLASLGVAVHKSMACENWVTRADMFLGKGVPRNNNKQRQVAAGEALFPSLSF